MTGSRRWLLVFAVAAGGLYALLAGVAIGPTARVEHHQSLGVGKDTEAIRRQPWTIVRYYGSVQGDAYWYYEHGRRAAGKPISTDTPVARLLAHEGQDQPRSESPLLPYRDFECQYPPAAVLIFAALAYLTADFDGFFALLRIVNFTAILGVMFFSYRSWQRLSVPGLSATSYWAAAVIVASATGPRWLCQYDALPTLCVAVLLWASLGGRWTVAGAVGAAGVLLKVYPIFLAPLVLIAAYRSQGWRGVSKLLASGGLTAALILSPWLVSSPADAVKGVKAQAGRAWLEYGSVAGSLLIVGKQIGFVDYTYGEELESRVLVSPLSGQLARVMPPLLGCAVLLVAAVFVLKQRRSGADDAASRRLAGAFLATLGTILLLAPVFSPQYVVWLLPGLLPLVGVSNRAAAAGVVLGACIQFQFPLIEGLPSSVKDRVLAVVLIVRDLALLTLTVAAWRVIGSAVRNQPPQDDTPLIRTDSPGACLAKLA